MMHHPLLSLNAAAAAAAEILTLPWTHTELMDPKDPLK